MPSQLSLLQLGQALFSPLRLFTEIARAPLSATRVFFGFVLWLAILPPLCAYVGTSAFGWRLGVTPITLPSATIAAVACAYFALLLVGFVSSAIVSRWMAPTYGADRALGMHFALIAIVGTPLAIGGIAHLYPQAFVNVIVLVPTLIWSMYLLYKGLPVVLKTDPGRGMLMASSLIAYLLVAWVSLLGVTVVLWQRGIGPEIGA